MTFLFKTDWRHYDAKYRDDVLNRADDTRLSAATLNGGYTISRRVFPKDRPLRRIQALDPRPWLDCWRGQVSAARQANSPSASLQTPKELSIANRRPLSSTTSTRPAPRTAVYCVRKRTVGATMGVFSSNRYFAVCRDSSCGNEHLDAQWSTKIKPDRTPPASWPVVEYFDRGYNLTFLSNQPP